MIAFKDDQSCYLKLIPTSSGYDSFSGVGATSYAAFMKSDHDKIVNA